MRKHYITFFTIFLVVALSGCVYSGEASLKPTYNPIIPTPTYTIASTPTSTNVPVPSVTALPHKTNFSPGWTTFTNANEMINGLAFDQDGYLWAASRGGLVKWNITNGTYRKYTTADDLPANRIDAVFVAKNGTLWIGASGGISSFTSAESKWVTHRNAKRQGVVEEIFQDRHGKLWFVGDGATTYDGKRWTTYSMDDGLGSNAVASIVEDTHGNIWLGTWFLNCGCEGSPKYIEGVSRFNGHQWDVLGAEIGLKESMWVSALAVDDRGGIWLGTTGFGDKGFGAKYFDGIETKTFTTLQGLSDNTIHDIQITKEGAVWFATAHGLTVYRNKNWKTFSTKDGLADNSVYSIAIAPDQSLWFGTGNGISQFDGTHWQTYRTNDGLPVTYVNNISSTEEGAVWFATDKGAAYFDGQVWNVLTKEEGLPRNAVSAVAVAPDGSVWFGMQPSWVSEGSGAIARLARGHWRITSSLDEQLSQGVHGIVFDQSGGVWVGSYGSYYFDGSQWTEYIADWVVHSDSLVFSPKSGYWTGGWGGVSRFDKHQWISYGPEYRNKVGWDTRALAVAPNGDVWVASELSDETFHTETGFKSFNGKDWKLETTLGYRDVTDMDFSQKGVLWVATREGAYNYDGKNWIHYTIEDGLAGNEITDIHVAQDGAIWFATFDGVTRFGK